MAYRGQTRFDEGTTRPLKCMACDLWFSTYDIWVSHLTSEAHQQQVSSRPGGVGNYFSHEHWREESIRDRCLIVSGVKSIGIGQLIRYLSRWGIVTDIIRQQEKIIGPVDYYYLQYESEESVMKVMTAQNRVPHQIQGQQIFFRRKYDRSVFLQNNRPNFQQTSLVSYGGGYCPTPSVVSMSAVPKLYPSPNGLGRVATQYRDESESALGLLKQTYGERNTEDMETEMSDEGEGHKVEEEHDLFSQKMTEHLANNLSNLKLEDQLEAFCKNILLPEPFLQARFNLIQELQGLFKNRYPKCAIYPCGPDYIGIGNSDDAVNVYVDLFDNQMGGTKEQPWEQSNDHHVSEILHILKLEQDNFRFCTNLRKNPKLTTLMDASTSAISPITFLHLASKVKCNLRTQNFPIVQESMFIKFLCTLDPRVRPLLVLIRYWSSFNQFFDGPDEDMRNRLPIFLMIFHLCNRKVVPSLSHLQSLEHPKMIWNNIDISFCGDIKKVPPTNMKMLQDKSISTLSILSMLKDFFQRFAVASLKENAICLWPAKFIQKKYLSPGKQDALDEDFVKKLRIGANGSIIMNSINHETPICVQHLFDMTSNITSNIGAEELKTFQMACWKTAEKIDEILNKRSINGGCGSGGPHIMDIFIGTSQTLTQTTSTSSSGVGNSIIKTEVITLSDTTSAGESFDEPQEIRIDPAKQETMNIEWEEFSRSLEQPCRPLSFLSKPVAPVAPSPKRNEVPNPLYSGHRFQHPKQSQAVTGTRTGPSYNTPAAQPVLVTKPPLHYQLPIGQMTGPDQRPSSSWNKRECEEEDDSDESSDDDDDDDSNDEDELEELPQIQTGHMLPSTLKKPLPMSKVKLNNSVKSFFLKAVGKHEFSYGGRGKMQSLWLQFLKNFNTNFWIRCFGLEMTLDPPYQNTEGEDYSKFRRGGERILLAAALDSVPNYEESYTVTFYCQSQSTMNRVLCANKNDFINTKYRRRQVQPLLNLLFGENLTSPGAHLQPISSQEELSFKCHFVVTLDYQDLRSDCFPSAQLVFERGSSGYGHLNQLIFLGKLFERMAPEFIFRSFKCWLGSCLDFDIQAALRNQITEKQEKGRLANLNRGGGLSKKKLKKKMAKAQARAEKARNLKMAASGSQGYGQEGRLIHRELGHGGVGQGEGGPSNSNRGKKSFQIPSGWNRSLDLHQQQPSFRGRRN